MKRLLLISSLLFFSLAASAQAVSIKRVELAGEKVIVIYDLEDSNPNNQYLLNLYTSKDNFAKAVTNVGGDVGVDIKPGVDKRIEWNLVKEFGGYKGKLSLEIRGRVYIPFIRMQDFNPSATYRRGKTYSIAWKAGNNNPVSIELFKGGQRIAGEMNHSNNGSYELFIPTHAKTGDDYKIKFTDSRNPDEIIYSAPFRVRPKIPLLVKAVPVVVAVAVVVLLTSKKKPSEKPGGVEEMEDPAFPSNP